MRNFRYIVMVGEFVFICFLGFDGIDKLFNKELKIGL